MAHAEKLRMVLSAAVLALTSAAAADAADPPATAVAPESDRACRTQAMDR
jgi:hypothetical protein